MTAARGMGAMVFAPRIAALISQLVPLRPVVAVARAVSAAALVACGPLLASGPAQAQQAGYGQTLGTSPLERQLYDGGSGRSSGGTILDSTNPIDLMNKIRKGTALDDATSPTSAIDDALRQLDAQTKPAPSSATGAGAAPASSARPVAATPSQPVQPGTASAPPAQPASSPQRPSL